LEPLTQVINKKYKNETVVLDGKAFHNCEFEDVTFWWNGTKPTQVIGCEKRPREELRFSSDNPLVLGTLQIVEALKDGKADIALFDGSAR
jgi:hypothetical protein